MTEKVKYSLSFSYLLCKIIFVRSNNFLVAFWIKFGETKQIVVAFVATTFKALFSVAKTSIGLSWREFYTGNIYYLFWNSLTHIPLLSAYKKVRPMKERTEKVLPPQLLSHELLTNNGMRKERKHFLPKVFSRYWSKIFNSCDKHILSRFCRFVNKI